MTRIFILVVLAMPVALTLTMCANDGTGTSGGMGSTGSTTGGTTGGAGTGTYSDCTAQNAAVVTRVTITDYAFAPSCVLVHPGTTVTFTNNGATLHTVTSDTGTQADDLPGSPIQSGGGTYQYTFLNTGTTKAHCDYHPSMMHITFVSN